jgi:hypothetical protein
MSSNSGSVDIAHSKGNLPLVLVFFRLQGVLASEALSLSVRISVQ